MSNWRISNKNSTWLFLGKDTFLPQESKPAFLNDLALNYISQLGAVYTMEHKVAVSMKQNNYGSKH